LSERSKARGVPARYVVGIDLGTTNSVVAYAELTAGDAAAAVHSFSIPQLIGAGTVEARSVLPSFLYLPADEERSGDALRLPWGSTATVVAGSFAQRRGTEIPARLIASAKSWLCHAGVDRTAPLLPFASPDDVPKLSPVEASAQLLSHLRQAWNHAFPQAPLEAQEVLLTVPASFDAVARDLTLRAAHDAGLPPPTVIEEPQAAFYSWIDALGDAWRQAVHVGDVVLVCDIGGGTTDFTLIAVRDEGGQVALERIAVGDHILLGGDNMDLALAHAVSQQLAGKGAPLDPWQLRGLTLSCREAKERLLGDEKVSKHAVSILGRGRKLIGGTVRAEIDRSTVDAIILAGFFPDCALEDRPLTPRRTALQELGLPYAADAAITRHLAAFLQRHGNEQRSMRPTAVLFNGGVMRATALRDRLLAVLNGWFADSPPTRVLSGGDPEHAVARGAAYYGLARHGRGVRIRGGIGRSYYIGIESAMPAVPGMRPPLKALCVVPRGLEEGTTVELPAQEFGLVVGEPAEFRFLTSASRGNDHVGAFIESWGDDITELAPLLATVDWQGHEGHTVPVRLEANVNELGVLELWCVTRDGTQRWRLELNVRHTQES
jgi:molecular chaperone DnaK (HSP70)